MTESTNIRHRPSAAFRDPLVPGAYLVAAVKEEHKLDICVVVHDLLPALKVVLIARESVDEETELLFIFLHGVFHGLTTHTRHETCWCSLLQSYPSFGS